MQRSKEEKAIIKYLLGQAGEAEQARIETAYFHDPEYHEQVLALEDDLIHEYLTDRMSVQERSLFELQFLASHRRREKYEFTKRLVAYANETAPVMVQRKTEKTFSWWNWLLPAQPKLVWAAAGGALVLCCGVWWALNSAKTTPDLNQPVPAGQVVAGRQTTSVESQSPVPQAGSGQIGEVPTPQPSNGGKFAAPKMAQPKTFAVALALLSGRDPGDQVTIQIPAGYEAVQLLVPIGEHPLYRSYEASIKTIDGEKIAQVKNLKVRMSGSKGLAVPVTVSAAKLQQTEYVLTMYGMAKSGQSISLGDAFFSIKND